MVHKRISVFTITILSSFLLLCYSVSASDWVLYDDFNSGVLDPARWEVYEPNPDVSSVQVVNGKLKITLRPLIPKCGERVSDLARAIITQNPMGIKAIKVKVKVLSCTEDARARVRVDRFQDSNDADFYQAINFFGANDVIEVWAEKWHLIDPEDLYWWTSLPFQNPTDIIGNIYTAVIKLHPDKFEAKIKEIGRIVYAPNDEDMTPANEQRIALDVKSSSGTGGVIVLYDNVYVQYY